VGSDGLIHEPVPSLRYGLRAAAPCSRRFVPDESVEPYGSLSPVSTNKKGRLLKAALAVGGGGGSRTPVRKPYIWRSTCLADSLVLLHEAPIGGDNV